ncbi:MAG: hypothetical protein ACQEXJ_23400 [Myxococcota bacterium]
MALEKKIADPYHTLPVVRDALRSRNVRVLAALPGPSWRGYTQRVARRDGATDIPAAFDVHFDWRYERNMPGSPLMGFFRKTMFKRIGPNLRRLGLVGDRGRRHYEAMGLLDLQEGKAAPELTADDLLADESPEVSPAVP